MAIFKNIFKGILQLGAESTATTQATAVIQSTSGSLALVPSGSGAITAAIPDGTATGGNARGIYAVDLQRARSNANQVASEQYTSILGGTNNRVIATNSTIAGGNSNYINGDATRGFSFIGAGDGNQIGSPVLGQRNFIGAGYQNTTTNSSDVVIGGGYQNSISAGGYGVIGGGLQNTVSSTHSAVLGGQSNTASTNTHATVVGGQSNTASGQYSIAGGKSVTASGRNSIAFGGLNTSSTASGQNSIVLGGEGNSATNYDSVAIGENCTSNAIGAFALGIQALAYLSGQQAISSNLFSTKGDAQQSLLTARRSDTLATGATTVLSLDGSGTGNFIIPNGNNRAWNVQIDTIAVVTAITGTATGVSVGDCYRETKQLLFKRIGGTSSIVGTVDTTAIKSNTSMATAAMTVTAGASQQMALTFTAPTFTGGGSVTCRVVSKVMLVEVAY